MGDMQLTVDLPQKHVLLGYIFYYRSSRVDFIPIYVKKWTYFYNSALFDTSHYTLHISTKKSKFWLIAVEQH